MYWRFFPLLFLLAMPPTVGAATITIRADDWCPYTCQPDSDKPGFLIEIAQYLFGKKGDVVDYQVMPWARAILETREGRYHSIAGAFKGDAPDFIFPENELAISVSALFAKQEKSWKFKDISSLESIAVGVIRDYSYGEQLDQYIEKHKKDTQKIQIVSGDNALELNIKKLILGRIDVFLEDPSVMSDYLAHHPLQEKIVNIGTVSHDKIYIAFSPHFPASREYAQILSDGIKEMRMSGKLQEILAKYGLKDWQ